MQSSKTFLDWLESATPGHLSMPKKAGQLLITREHKDYCLRHINDAEKTNLKKITTTTELLETIRTDPNKNYRPLKFSNDLIDGWIAGPFDIHGLREAIDILYPIAIGLWYRWKQNNLSLISYQKTAARQTGRYKVTASLNIEQIKQTICQLCDHKCLRQRLWPISEEPPLFAQEKFRELPLLCPEPCSLFIERARELIENSPTGL